MGVVTRPGTNRLYFRFANADGVWVSKPSSYVKGQETQAKAAFKKAMKLAEDGDDSALATPTGDVTLDVYAEAWLTRREAKGIAGARNERTHLELHVLPVLGKLTLEQANKRRCRDVLDSLKTKPRSPITKAERLGEVKVTDPLSTRTIRHIRETMSSMFADAVDEERIPVNPMSQLRRGTLAPIKDKQINRRLAVFAVSEVEQMISDPRIPVALRVVYAVLFLTGVRPEEMVVLTWRAYDAEREPLGSIHVTEAFSRELGEVTDTKTKIDREIPVHPTLAVILAEAQMEFRRVHGRPPGPDELICPPTTKRAYRSLPGLNSRFKDDCARIGLRVRNVYCARRTFISMARTAGAAKDDLKWITHGRQRDQVDDYTTMFWEFLCRLVSPIRVERLAGEVIPMRKAASAQDPQKPAVQVLVQVEGPAKRNGPGIATLGRSFVVGAAGFERSTGSRPRAVADVKSAGWSGRQAPAGSVGAGFRPIDLHDLHECARCAEFHAAFEEALHGEDPRERRAVVVEIERHLAGEGA